MSDENLKMEITSMGGPSYEILAIQDYLKTTKSKYDVLDLGCGDGRNSIFFASLGHKVTAIDSSKQYISFLKKAAILGRYNLEPICSDVQDWDFNKSYDVVLAHGLLHYFTKKHACQFIKKMQVNTKSGGLNVVTIAPSTEEGDIPEDFKRSGHINPFSPMELIEQYEGWRLVLREHYVKWDCHPGVGVHSHPIEKWIFVKKGEEEFPIDARKIQESSSYSKSRSELEIKFKELDINSKFTNSYFATIDMDNVSKFQANGVQLSSKSLSKMGYCLFLYQVKNFVLYVVDDVVVGKSRHYADIHKISTRVT